MSYRSCNIAVLVSGRGSNLQALIEAEKEGRIKAHVAVAISNRPETPALQRARQFQIATEVVEPVKGESRDDYDQRLIKLIQEYSIDLIVLAGFMRILSPQLIAMYPHRIINIHPSLLPSFPGLDAQKQALEAGVKTSGCTVHFVDEGCDTGPIILQKEVPVKPNDTVETLSARILTEEHVLLPKVVDLISQNKVKVVDRKVEII